MSLIENTSLTLCAQISLSINIFGHIVSVRNKAIVAALVLLIIAGVVLFPTQLSEYVRPPADRQTEQKKKSADKDLKPVNQTWTASVVFSGEAAGQTDAFSVPRGPWRLRWEVDGYPSAANLGLSVIPTDQLAEPVLEKHGITAPGKGVVTIPRGGEFYIRVSSYEANWKLTVETR